MKKTALTAILCLLLVAPFAQAQSNIEVNIKHKNTPYWIEVADRNCGATSNKINSYGDLYVWNESTDSKAREFMGTSSTSVGSACDNFRGGKAEGWRLPTASEVRFLMSKLELKSTHAILRSERNDTTQFAYLPFGGYKESTTSARSNLNRAGAYWTSEGNKRSKYASILFITSEFPNNSMQPKTFALSARCVRDVE